MTALLFAPVLAGVVWAQSETQEPIQENRQPALTRYQAARSTASEWTPGRWISGGSVGLLGSTPDGTALALNGNADYFVNEHISLGPLLQVGLTGDMTQIGLSGQGKYWVTSPANGAPGQLYLQAGVGFVHADFLGDDTSWLVPLGVGFDYPITPAASLTSSFLVNFTDLHTRFGTGADVMPGLTFGVRF